ncbi:MAG: septum formation initiator family protein [Patescibacteria group bacterium]|nr:septum formation initiator family protein [Patescibacteria group bacterium]
MINRRKNNYFKKIFFNQKFLTLLGLAAIILISFPFAKNTLKQYRINKEISELKKEISDLQNKNVDLKNFVSYLESDQFAEEQARLNLGLKKPGEELTVIKSAAGDNSAGTSSGASIFNIPGYEKGELKDKKSNPKKWLNYFFR